MRWYTVKLPYNEPLYNEILHITNYFSGPGHLPLHTTLKSSIHLKNGVSV
jgi:hypothetical protein